eukprot:GHVU01235213.1.p1 GENE.GHVU01235213.1~~GHVU01235213.1.p1  ORF type:complete len:126 (+),score=15.27 GHVU01235213.1:189-566(+)
MCADKNADKNEQGCERASELLEGGREGRAVALLLCSAARERDYHTAREATETTNASTVTEEVTHGHMHAHAHTHTRTHPRTHPRTCTHTCTQTRTQTRMHAHTHVYMHTSIYISVHERTFTVITI